MSSMENITERVMYLFIFVKGLHTFTNPTVMQ